MASAEHYSRSDRRTDAAIRKIAGPDIVVEKTLYNDGNSSFWYCPLSADQEAAVGGLGPVGALLILMRTGCL